MKNKASFLSQRVGIENFKRIFEIEGKKDFLYILTHTNRDHFSGNLFNPMFSEVTLSQIDQSKFLGYSTPDIINQRQSLKSHAMDRLPKVCMVDYIPGVVLKISFS